MMDEEIKEKILKGFDEVMQPKCSECGAKLPTYPYYDECYEYRLCKKCGHMNMKQRVNQQNNNYRGRKWKYTLY